MNEFLTEYKEAGVNMLAPEHIDYLKKGQLKTEIKYRILKRTPNTDPQRKKGDDWIYPSCISIPLSSRIKKPSGGVATVGVGEYDPLSNKVAFKRYQHIPSKGDGGYFKLYANNIEDIEAWPALELSNKNKSNPFRDQSEVPLFERVDEVKESKARSSKRNYLYDSLDAIRHWTSEEMRISAAENGIPDTLDIDTIKDRLEELAEKDPETFYNGIGSIENKMKAIINLAKSRNIISYSAFENKWFYVGSGETIVLLERKEGVDEMKQFVNFLMNSPKGGNVQEHLKKLIKNQ